MDGTTLPGSNDKLPSLPAAKTVVDEGGSFVRTQGTNGAVMRWEGFLKCKRAAVYTFTFNKPYHSGNNWLNGYSVRINGNPVVKASQSETSVDVDLQAGWNKVEIVCQFNNADPLTVSYKPKGSLAEPRPLGPKDLFYDKPEDHPW